MDTNDVVKKDQVLAELESSVERAAVDLARWRANLDTEVMLRSASLGFAERNRTRVEDLYKRQVSSLHVKDEAETELTVAQLQTRKAKENKKIAELELKRERARLRLKTVRSPIDGIVVMRYHSVGEYVETEPILRVAQLDPLRVDVIVPVDRFGSITTGMEAHIYPELDSSGELLAVVSRVERVVDAASGTFVARLELPNPDYEIPSGLRCTVQFLPEQLAPSTVESYESPQG